MNQLQLDHGEWTNKQFASHHKEDGTPNPLPPFRHLIDYEKGEVWELATALSNGDPTAIAKELADCQLLLYGIASLCGVDLEQAAWEKYHVNKARRWGEPDPDGIVEHVRGKE